MAAVVMLPARLGFGKLAEQRRAGREAGDFAIEATGGRAILAEELPGTDPEPLVAGIGELGENPSRTLIFSIIAARENRTEETVIPGVKGAPPVRRYVDYTVRLDIRNADTDDVRGSIETYATAYANSPDFDSRGRPTGLAQAMRDAIVEAVRKFAPRLAQPATGRRAPALPVPLLAELPRRGGGAGGVPPAADARLTSAERLRRLLILYPEVAEADLSTLAASPSARFLVIVPGTLAALGLQAHDLVGGLGGSDLGSRAAFARRLARGDGPALSVDRGGARFLIGASGAAAVLAHAP